MQDIILYTALLVVIAALLALAIRASTADARSDAAPKPSSGLDRIIACHPLDDLPQHMKRRVRRAVELIDEFRNLDERLRSEWLDEAEMFADFRHEHPTFMRLWDGVRWSVSIPGKHVNESTKQPLAVTVAVHRMDGAVATMRVVPIIWFDLTEDDGANRRLTVAAILDENHRTQPQALESA